MPHTYLQVQMSEPKTSLPLHSSCTRRARRTFGSAIFAGSPKTYTVRPPMGGRKILISLLVTSSGYDPPVCSNKARRRVCSSKQIRQLPLLDIVSGGIPIPNLSATPGRYHTGSTATFVTASSPVELRQIFPSGTSLPERTLPSSSGSFM